MLAVGPKIRLAPRIALYILQLYSKFIISLEMENQLNKKSKSFNLILNNANKTSLTFGEETTYEDFVNYMLNNYPTYFDFRFGHPEQTFMLQKITKTTWPIIKAIVLQYKRGNLSYLDKADNNEQNEDISLVVVNGEFESESQVINKSIVFKEFTKKVKEMSGMKQLFVMYQLDTNNNRINKITDDKSLSSAFNIARNNQFKIKIYQTIQDPQPHIK